MKKNSLNKNQNNNSKSVKFDAVPTLTLQVLHGTTIPGGNVNLVTAIGMLHEALNNLTSISRGRYIERSRQIMMNQNQKEAQSRHEKDTKKQK